MARRLVLLLAAAALASVIPSRDARAAGSPPAEGMVLAVVDFPGGASVGSQERAAAASLPHVASTSAFTRSFTGVRVDGVRIDSLVASAIAVAHVSDARSFMRSLGRAAGSPLERAALIAAFRAHAEASLVPSGLPIASAVLVRARVLEVGAAVEFVFSLRSSAASVELGEIYVRHGAGLELVRYLAGAGGVPAAEDVSLARKAAARIAQAEAPLPRNTAPPVVSGRAEGGALLRASVGRWRGAPPGTSYVYQWYRCPRADHDCTPIVGATSPDYAVRAADKGRTLTVSVTATSPAGATSVVARRTPPIGPAARVQRQRRG